MAKIKVYTMEYCPYCKQAKALLQRRGIEFQEEMVKDDDDAKWAELFKLSGMKTMPIIFSGDKLIGGYTDLSALDGKDQLASLK
jgi:glutaredoxin 3